MVRNNGKSYREHRFITEKRIGRKLLRNEHVHHINGVKDDNRPENLIVLTASDHHRQHAEENREFYLKALRKGRKNNIARLKKWKESHWSLKWDFCIQCKRKDGKHQGHGKCSRCYLKEYSSSKS